MKLTIPIYVEEQKIKGGSEVYVVRPVFQPIPVRRGEQLERAMWRLRSDISRALQELSARLGQLDGLSRRGEMGEMRKCARSLGAIAEQLGMPALARVARDAGACSEGGDPVALAAVLARLQRVGEVSLARIWELPAG